MSGKNSSSIKYGSLGGIVSFFVITSLVCILWYVFMHANGIMKLYTPMYGFSLVAVLMVSVVLISKVLDFYPLSPVHGEGSQRLIRGIFLSIMSVVLALVIVYGVFWNFLGKYGIAYFSPESIIASGGTGAEPFNARENASTAIIYFSAAFLWWGLAWNLGFVDWPWTSSSPGVRAWSKTSTVMLLTILTYILCFHPHVCFLFYPPQNKAGVEPWWSSFAGTGSAFFSLGFVLCGLAWVVISDLLWEKYPWKVLGKDEHGGFFRGIFAVVGSLALGFLSFILLLKIMNIYWMEPFEGGQYTDAPYFRYLHAGEIAGFCVLAAFILKNYFNNWPNWSNLFFNAIIRTGVVFIIALIIYAFYYSPLSTMILGKVPGIAQPDDTPLVWTMLFLTTILIHAEFFSLWPMKPKD
ncbi:MAG: hypothetical protein PHS86_03945 [Syntrophaceae bacterium]|nr:hypothetical protein [Syntrophaceae bacterium]